MNTVVNELLEVDREARQMLDEARQYHEHTLVEIEEEKKRLLETYRESADAHISQLSAEQADEVEETVSALQARITTALGGMEQLYDQNHLRWEEDLCNRCIAGFERRAGQ